MKLRTLIFSLGIAVAGVGLVTACAVEKSTPTRSLPLGASFSGLWYSNFGDMKLTTTSDGKVRGSFDYKSGGVIDGQVEGGVMKFRWTQLGDFQVGRREVVGMAYLVISDDGLALEGEWGYGESYFGGGEWTAKKATERY